MKTIAERAERFRKRLEARKITLREVAEQLGCNETYLCRVFSHSLQRVESSTSLRAKRAKLAQSRREMREKHANLVISRRKSLEKAAADAKCSVRTMRRYVARLEA